MTLSATVLVVEDDQDMRLMLEEELSEAGYRVLSAADGRGALEQLAGGEVDVVVTDLILPGIKGSEVLAEVRAREPDVPVLIMTAFGSIDSAVESMKAGAYHYVAKPFRIEHLLETLENALRDRTLKRQLTELSRGAESTAIVAVSPSMRRAMDLVRRAASADAPVLLLGESGTGKELLARMLHLEGSRRKGPFVAVNCSAIPETLLESQLFGHRRGAFTDAREDRRGLFHEADGGTVFLDEIGDMPLALQAKLLRVLQEHEIHPLGAPAPIPINIRIVAATHRDLEAWCLEGRFRRDLYYRLKVIAVRIPPLRERQEDLVPLIGHVLGKHGPAVGRSPSVAPEVVARLMSYSWPGNVRELENVIERALVLGSGDVIGVEDLPEEFRPAPGVGAGEKGVRLLADVEREQILMALRSVKGNKAAAARMLGLDRKTLYRKLELYGIRAG